MILAQAILTSVTNILNDADLVHWTQDELLHWLSDGQREIVIRFPDAKTRTRDMQLVAGSRQSVPDDCIAIIDVAYNKDGDVVTPCDRTALDMFCPSWGQKPVAKTVKHWIPTEDPKVFYVYPAQVASSPAIVEIVASVYPKIIGSVFDAIDVRDIYAERLTSYILYRAFSKDAEFAGAADRAVAYYQAFAS
jgi:hypothetical protein